MTRKERIVLQRTYAIQAIAKLRCAEEYFGVEDGDAFSHEDFYKFSKKIDELEKWLFEESPIA